MFNVGDKVIAVMPVGNAVTASIRSIAKTPTGKFYYRLDDHSNAGMQYPWVFEDRVFKELSQKEIEAEFIAAAKADGEFDPYIES